MSRRRTTPVSLRRQIVLWYSVVLLLALSVFAGLAYLLLEQALERTSVASVRQTAEAVERVMISPSIPRAQTREEFVEVEGPDGVTVEGLWRRTRLVTGQVSDIFVPRIRAIEAGALRAFVIIALVLIPLTAAAAAWGGRVLAERLLIPLDRLVGATREIGIGDLSRRVEEPEEPEELQELAQSFNGMLTRLESAVSALRRFTADASHELRTPLTSIRGTIQVALARERSADELKETLGEVIEETEWMLHLVEGLLTLARGEETATLPARQPVDLLPLLHDAQEVGEVLAGGKPVRILLDAPPSLEVVGVAGPLRQVFLNLVSNAVKFTQEGEVRIAAREIPDGMPPGAPARAEVRVTDTGIGIPPDELPRVFDRFYRGEAGRSRPGGTGLGLAIAKLVVQQHGGEIDVESEPRHGSTFRVTLPKAAPAGSYEL